MDVVSRQFGLVIAFILPGFIALLGLVPFSPVVASWFDADHAAGVAAPIYAILAATAVGMVISAIRWLLIDSIHNLTLGQPRFNARALDRHVDAFQFLIEGHYRFYQNYSHTLVAVGWTYSSYRWLAHSPQLSVATDAAILILCIVLFTASHDALKKYRHRIALIAGGDQHSQRGDDDMTNGIDHPHGTTTSTPKTAAPSPAKPKPAPTKPGPNPSSQA